TVRELGGHVQYRIALLGAIDGESVPFHIVQTAAGSGSGSSVFAEKARFSQTTLILPTQTLDRVRSEIGLKPPHFLKLDVQGYELEVLRGAPQTLDKTEAVLLEVSLLEYNAGAPLAAEVIADLDRRGFALFDICSQTRRQSDDTLFQSDLIFVRKDSQ